jgi:hypothetical protein
MQPLSASLKEEHNRDLLRDAAADRLAQAVHHRSRWNRAAWRRRAGAALALTPLSCWPTW